MECLCHANQAQVKCSVGNGAWLSIGSEYDPHCHLYDFREYFNGCRVIFKEMCTFFCERIITFSLRARSAPCAHSFGPKSPFAMLHFLSPSTLRKKGLYPR